MPAPTCPTPQQLSDWLSGAANDGSSAELEAHIETCEICKQEIDRLESGDALVAELAGIAKSPSQLDLGEERLAQITSVYRLAQKPDRAQYPSRIRDYELLDLLGEGGMGTVFRARHVPLNRMVALKILPPGSGQRVERFQRELAHHGPLDHPQIVKALDAGEAEGVHFLVTELVEGKNAAQVVAEEGPLPPQRACDIARQAAQALAYLHDRGLVHRDVKPSNLMIDSAGQVRLLDLGLVAPAAEESPDDRMTKDKIILGTPDYIAPEQIVDPRGVDGRADLYGLGCTLYHLLTGKPPFGDYSLLQKLHAHQYEAPDMTRLPPSLPGSMFELLSQLLAKQAVSRPAKANEVSGRLLAFSPNSSSAPFTSPPPVVQKPFSPAPAGPPPKSSRGLVTAIIVIAALVLCAPFLLIALVALFWFFASSSVLEHRPPIDGPEQAFERRLDEESLVTEPAETEKEP